MAKKIRLDFTKVEERSGWNTRHIPEGLHKMKVVAVEDSEAQDGTDMWVFALVPADKKYATRRFPFYCKLQPNQLWKVRDLFVAAGIPVPKKATMLDPNKVVGKFIAAEAVDETGQYEGRSSINGTYGLDVLDDIEEPTDEDELDEEEGDEEEYDDAPEEDEEEDEEEEEDEDLEALTLPELRKLAKSFGVDTTGLKKAELIEAIQEEQEADEDDEDEDDLDDEDLEDEELDDEEFEDDEEDEEEEPEPAPKRRAAPTRKAAPAKAAPKRTVRRR